MKRVGLTILLTVAVAAPALSKDAPAPDLLRRAFSAPASVHLFAYDFVNTSTSTDGSKGGPRTQTVRGHIDPSRKKGDRVTIISAEGQGQDGKPVDLKKLDEQMEKGGAEGGIFCDEFSEPDVTGAVDKGMAADGHAYAFTPKAEAKTDGNVKDIMKKVAAEAVVDPVTGALKRYSGRLTKPHSVFMVATVKSFDLAVTCAPAPDGRAFSARTDLKMSISAFGKDFDAVTSQSVSGLTPAGAR